MYMYMYMYMYVCMYVCILQADMYRFTTKLYIYINIHILIYIHTCVHIRASHGSGRLIYEALDMQHLVMCFSDGCMSMRKPV